MDISRALLALKQKQSDALSVRAGISGVLVELDHQVGEHVTAGTTLAKVVQPDQLKASLKIAETQARDIQIGQPAEIDTHNGVIDGKVTRIDPAVLNGTVTVDVELAGALPQGARPDLSVDGTIDQSYHLLDDLTVAENIDLPLPYKNISKPERQALVADTLDHSTSSARKTSTRVNSPVDSSSW